MNYNQSERFDTANVSSNQVSASFVANYIAKVYGWMFLGLLTTAVMAYVTATTPAISNFVFSSKLTFYGIMIAELAIVVYLAARVHKMSVAMATGAFFLYAALNGLVFSALLYTFPISTLASVFGITAGTFAIMSAIGYYTKTDLTSFGKLMMMGLIGIIIASIVNWFMASEMLYWIISYVGVAVFVGLIAYDTQKIKSYAYIPDAEMRKKGAIMGALSLYLDFINLFIMLLRIFGNRN